MKLPTVFMFRLWHWILLWTAISALGVVFFWFKPQKPVIIPANTTVEGPDLSSDLYKELLTKYDWVRDRGWMMKDKK